MKKLTFACMVITMLILLTGCGNNWSAEQRIETNEERIDVMEHQAQMLSKIPTPTTLGGDDQDWEDVVWATYNIAIQTNCKFRLYERNHLSGGYTGRMKEMDQVKKSE